MRLMRRHFSVVIRPILAVVRVLVGCSRLFRLTVASVVLFLGLVFLIRVVAALHALVHEHLVTVEMSGAMCMHVRRRTSDNLRRVGRLECPMKQYSH